MLFSMHCGRMEGHTTFWLERSGPADMLHKTCCITFTLHSQPEMSLSIPVHILLQQLTEFKTLIIYYKYHLCLIIFFQKNYYFTFFIIHPTETLHGILFSLIAFCAIGVTENRFFMCFLQAMLAEETQISSRRVVS